MKNYFKIIRKYLLFNRFLSSSLTILVFTALISCGVPEFAKPKKVSRDTPANAKERARKNIEEGRGVSLKGVIGGRSKSTNYEFSTSNPLWRASLELIDFMPLATVDYSGGIIITDWFSDSNSTKDSIKITIRFLSNEVQSNSLKIIVHQKNCKVADNCSIKEINSKIKPELTQSIITRAAKLELDSKNSKKK